MMAVSYQQLLAGLISGLDGEAQLILRRAFVRLAFTYADSFLQGEEASDERVCLGAAALWLEQPKSPESLRAIEAALEREGIAAIDTVPPHQLFWDVVQTTRVPLDQAAQLAAEVAAQVGGWLNPAAARIDPQRGPRLAAQTARVATTQWQLSAAQAILDGREPPPLPTLPEPLDDPAQIFAAFRRAFDFQLAYRRGDAHTLRLLLTAEQTDELARLALAQAIVCARALLPPPDEDRGERACLGEPGERAPVAGRAVDQLFRRIAVAREAPETRSPLRDACAALVTAHARRRQADMAEAVTAGALRPAEPSEPGPLSGQRVEYRLGQLQRLCAGLDIATFQQLKPALVQQALWYAARALPDADEWRAQRTVLEVMRRWLDGLDREPPVAALEPPPAGTPLPRALVWNAARFVAQAAAATDAADLLRAVDAAVVCGVAARAGTTSTGAEAQAAAYHARDYQLAAIASLVAGEKPRPWSGPEAIYSHGSLDATIRQMNTEQQGHLRLALLGDACVWVRRGLEARLEPPPRLLPGLRLVAAIEQWVARGDTVMRGATPEPDAAVRAAAEAARQPSENAVTELAIALGLATHPAPTPAQTDHATRQVARHCEQAASFAARALAERWELDATYAILCDAEPPQLTLPLRGEPPLL